MNIGVIVEKLHQYNISLEKKYCIFYMIYMI